MILLGIISIICSLNAHEALSRQGFRPFPDTGAIHDDSDLEKRQNLE
jgi:hypothetical protein